MAVHEIQKFPDESEVDSKESEPRKGLANPDIGFHSAPKDGKLTGFPGAIRIPGNTPVQGGHGQRERWRLEDGKILEWDRRHETVEMYNRAGKTHLGEFDPQTGG